MTDQRRPTTTRQIDDGVKGLGLVLFGLVDVFFCIINRIVATQGSFQETFWCLRDTANVGGALHPHQLAEMTPHATTSAQNQHFLSRPNSFTQSDGWTRTRQGRGGFRGDLMIRNNTIYYFLTHGRTHAGILSHGVAGRHGKPCGDNITLRKIRFVLLRFHNDPTTITPGNVRKRGWALEFPCLSRQDPTIAGGESDSECLYDHVRLAILACRETNDGMQGFRGSKRIVEAWNRYVLRGDGQELVHLAPVSAGLGGCHHSGCCCCCCCCGDLHSCSC